MSDNYIGIILEEIRDQNRAVLEAVGDMQEKVAKIPAIEVSVDELKSDVGVIKVVIKDISRKLDNHEQRIIQLETA